MKKKKKGEQDLRMTGIEEEKDYKENRRKVLSRKNFSSIVVVDATWINFYGFF